MRVATSHSYIPRFSGLMSTKMELLANINRNVFCSYCTWNYTLVCLLQFILPLFRLLQFHLPMFRLLNILVQ